MRLVAALTWEPQVKGALYVLLAVLILVGTPYMVLATDVGARLGFLLAGAGLFGWLLTGGIIWTVYGQGPIGPAPSWKSQGLIIGDLAASSRSALQDFPEGWKKLELTDKQVADAAPVADGILAPAEGDGPFEAPTEYVLVGAYEKGGEDVGPFGLKLPRPLDLWHTPHYIVLQVQPAVQEPDPAGGPPRNVPDPTAQPVAVLLLRDLGGERLHPFVFTVAVGILFGLFCYQLHVRDKEAEVRKQEESGRLQPVLR